MQTLILTHHSLLCSVGLSFCAMWYKALIAFMLNSGGFLSATNQTDRLHQGVRCFEAMEREKYMEEKVSNVYRKFEI